jgi:pyruvate/2-oxoglutarate dehydrogenase complex dihydrolipoamide dehydrogenase (E3) component
LRNRLCLNAALRLNLYDADASYDEVSAWSSATCMNSYGVDVIIIEFLPRAPPNEDVEILTKSKTQFKKLAVKVCTSTKVESIDERGHAVTVTVTVSKNGKSEELRTEKVLQAIGFAPNIDGHGLDKTGVEVTDRRGHPHRRLHAHQPGSHLRDR